MPAAACIAPAAYNDLHSLAQVSQAAGLIFSGHVKLPCILAMVFCQACVATRQAAEPSLGKDAISHRFTRPDYLTHEPQLHIQLKSLITYKFGPGQIASG